MQGHNFSLCTYENVIKLTLKYPEFLYSKRSPTLSMGRLFFYFVKHKNQLDTELNFIEFLETVLVHNFLVFHVEF